MNWHPQFKTDCPTMPKFKFWAFENERTNARSVGNFSGPLPRPRGHKLKGQFLKIVDIKKVAQEGYLKSLSTPLNP